MQTSKLADHLHICCAESAAGSVKQFLKGTTGIRTAPVICSSMMENAGPLTLLDHPQVRLDWFGSIGFDIHIYRGFIDDGPLALVNQWQTFWTRIDEWTGPFVIWFSSANAADRSLLLAAANRIGENRAVMLIDVAQAVGGLPGRSDVGELSPDELRLWRPQAEQLDVAGRQRLFEDYARFVAAPLALRLFSQGQLIEAPIEGLDERILSRLTADWAPLARTCARIEGAFGNRGFRDFDYTWMLWRLDVLHQTGGLERRGGEFDPHFRDDPLKGDVKLPS